MLFFFEVKMNIFVKINTNTRTHSFHVEPYTSGSDTVDYQRGTNFVRSGSHSLSKHNNADNNGNIQNELLVHCGTHKRIDAYTHTHTTHTTHTHTHRTLI